MGKWEKVLDSVISGANDPGIPFDDLCGLLERLGFDRRTKGSHNIFRRTGITERPNLQRAGKHAKPYQVRQVREIIVRYNLRDKL